MSSGLVVLTPSLTPHLGEGQAGLGAGTQEGRTHTGQHGHRTPSFYANQLHGLPHSLAHLSPSPLGPPGLPESSSVEETIFLVPVSS